MPPKGRCVFRTRRKSLLSPDREHTRLGSHGIDCGRWDPRSGSSCSNADPYRNLGRYPHGPPYRTELFRLGISNRIMFFLSLSRGSSLTPSHEGEFYRIFCDQVQVHRVDRGEGACFGWGCPRVDSDLIERRSFTIARNLTCETWNGYITERAQTSK